MNTTPIYFTTSYERYLKSWEKATTDFTEEKISGPLREDQKNCLKCLSYTLCKNAHEGIITTLFLSCCCVAPSQSALLFLSSRSLRIITYKICSSIRRIDRQNNPRENSEGSSVEIFLGENTDLWCAQLGACYFGACGAALLCIPETTVQDAFCLATEFCITDFLGTCALPIIFHENVMQPNKVKEPLNYSQNV